MAQKIRKIEEFIALSAEAPKVVSYADYFIRNPLFTALQVKNSGAVAIEGLRVSISNENGLVTPYTKEIGEIPFESKVEIDLPCILSPLYFVKLEEVKEEEILIELFKDKKSIVKTSVVVTTLPFDYWEGMQGNVERLAGFVRPKLADCGKIRSDVAAQLKKWEVASDLEGYEGCDKNVIRRTAAALFAAIRKVNFERVSCDMTKPLEVSGTKLLTDRRATNIKLALFACAALESFGLHPILAVGEKELGVGVWLYDGCFMDTTSDDMVRLEKYASDGINNVSCFDVEDLFSDKNSAYATSEKHFLQKLSDGKYDCYIDIRRLRIAKVLPLPIRTGNVSSAKGYEVLGEDETSPYLAPKELTEKKSLALGGKQTKDKQWERRLLDL